MLYIMCIVLIILLYVCSLCIVYYFIFVYCINAAVAKHKGIYVDTEILNTPSAIFNKQ